MKRSIKILATVIFTAMLMACICPAVLAADANTLSITSAEVTGERGETVEVSLVVTENPGFAAIRITVEETAGFTVTEVKNGTIMKTMTPGKNILWDDSKNSTKTGVLVTLKITIDADAPVGRNTVNVKLRECYNESLDKVSVSIAPIVINVPGSAEPDPVETGSASGSTTEESSTENSSAQEPETESAAPADTLVINIQEVSAARGDVIKVVLNVTANPGISGLIITVPEIEGFDLRDVANGTVMSTMTSGLNILWDGLSDSTETGTLVTLTYMVSDEAALGNNSVSVKVRSCTNESGKEVAVVIDPIVITVTEGTGEGVDTETSDGGNSADIGSGCAGGCSGEIGVGAIILTTLIAGAWFFGKKH